MSVQSRIEAIFDRLATQPGYVERPAQRQLALFLADLIEGSQNGAIEAPTGLGKSLATLIPAIAHAIDSGKRTVIATYTNVLAEQYWRKDLPFALTLFGDDAEPLRTQFLIGKQRYACLAAMEEVVPDLREPFQAASPLGIETDWMGWARMPAKTARETWLKIVTPAVCAGRACPAYEECFYYGARRQVQDAHVIITNHSVVIQHALTAGASEDGKGLFGKFDYLLLDEAHDFYGAAVSGLEFELSSPKLSMVTGVAGRLERELLGSAISAGRGDVLREIFETLRRELDGVRRALVALPIDVPQAGILAAAPNDVADHRALTPRKVEQALPYAESMAAAASHGVDKCLIALEREVTQWGGLSRQSQELYRNSVLFLKEFGDSCAALLQPRGVSVSYSDYGPGEPRLRLDTVGVDGPLKELLWPNTPTTSLSATLAVDGAFDFYNRMTGFEPIFEEILPTPFDFAGSAAMYLPRAEAIPDPTLARRNGTEEEYFAAIARELSQIIELMEGRTLALFHSRREMEAVFARVRLLPDFPVYVQPKTGAARIGEQFKNIKHSSLFALRSFWTGFDAPGDTCSCVVVVRVPFEVPVEPSAIVRMASLHLQGMDPFQAYTLPMAKMMVRQGVGRLIRRDGDKGVIALLDPRLRTKPYGPEILENLPAGMRVFDDFSEAVAWTGLLT